MGRSLSVAMMLAAFFGCARPSDVASISNWMLTRFEAYTPALWTDGRYVVAASVWPFVAATRADGRSMGCDFDAR